MEDVQNLINIGPTNPIQILNQHEDRKSTGDKANISNPKVNRGCAPLTANRTSADCVQISLGPSIPYILLGVYHTGRSNAMFQHKRVLHNSVKGDILCYWWCVHTGWGIGWMPRDYEVGDNQSCWHYWWLFYIGWGHGLELYSYLVSINKNEKKNTSVRFSASQQSQYTSAWVFAANLKID